MQYEDSSSEFQAGSKALVGEDNWKIQQTLIIKIRIYQF